MNTDLVDDPRSLRRDDALAPFGHPDEVVDDPVLSCGEKREILAHWISDAHAVEDAPAWRRLDGGALVRVDDILQALKVLDNDLGRRPRTYRRPRSKSLASWIRHAIQLKRFDDDDDGPPPCPASAALPLGMPFRSAEGQGDRMMRAGDAMAA